MKVLITGSEGYLARNLAKNLYKKKILCYGIGWGNWKTKNQYKKWGYKKNLNGNISRKLLNKFFSYLERKSYKIQYRIISSRYKGKTKCENCLGSGIRTEAHYVKINNKSILDLVVSPINKVLSFIENLYLNNKDKKISNRIINEIKTRLSYINSIGLGYLTLNRKLAHCLAENFKELN